MSGRGCVCGTCRTCRDRVRMRERYRALTPEQKRRTYDTPERIAQRRAYHEANRERKLLEMRTRYLANHETRKEQQRTYNAAHREELRQKARTYRTTPESRAKHRAYEAAHHEEILARAQRLRAANQERYRGYGNARRVRKLGNGGSHTDQEWLDKVALFGGLCAYCGEARPLEREHNVPLVRGGTDNIDNILPACRSCNGRKYNRTAAEFLALAV